MEGKVEKHDAAGNWPCVRHCVWAVDDFCHRWPKICHRVMLYSVLNG